MAKRLRWMALGGMLTLALVAGGAFGAAKIARAKSLGDFFFGPRFARGEIVLVQDRQVHDYRVDRGHVKSIRSGVMELRELDGTVQAIQVSGSAQVTVNGQPASLSSITRGMVVTTVRDGGAPAQQVIAQVGGAGPR